MKAQWFNSVVKLAGETIAPYGHDISMVYPDIERITLLQVKEDGETAALAIDLSFGMSGGGSSIYGVPLNVWEDYKKKLAEILSTLFVNLNGEHLVFPEAMEKINAMVPGLSFDITELSYSEKRLTLYDDKLPGEFLALIVAG